MTSPSISLKPFFGVTVIPNIPRFSLQNSLMSLLSFSAKSPTFYVAIFQNSCSFFIIPISFPVFIMFFNSSYIPNFHVLIWLCISTYNFLKNLKVEFFFVPFSFSSNHDHFPISDLHLTSSLPFHHSSFRNIFSYCCSFKV